MKKIVIHAGFHPEVEREYKGEHIYKVTGFRDDLEGKDFHTGRATGAKLRFFRLDNGAWIKDLGGDKYETDWTSEERWGRVEELELDEKGEVVSAQDLGFMILRVDTSGVCCERGGSMNLSESIKNYILTSLDMDLVGIAPAAALAGEPSGHRPEELLPGAKSIIVFGRALADGAMQGMFRAHEDKKVQAQSAYAAYCDDLAPNFLLVNDTFRLACYIEDNFGGVAMPITFNVQQSMIPRNYPGKFFADPYGQGMPLDIWKAAMAAGLGEFGWSNRFVTKEFGPRQMLSAVLTTLELEADGPYMGEKICLGESCGICAKVCPTGAIPGVCSGCTALKAVEGKTQEVGEINPAACAVAALGMRKEFQGRVPVPNLIMNNAPTDEELAAAFEKKPVNGLSIEHFPRYLCERCLIDCPLGKWKERFKDTGFTSFEG